MLFFESKIFRIPLKMDAKVAAKITALRPCIDACVVNACKNPESLANQSATDLELIQLLKDLSMENAGKMEADPPSTDNGPPPKKPAFRPYASRGHPRHSFNPRPRPYGAQGGYGGGNFGSNFEPRSPYRGGFGGRARGYQPAQYDRFTPGMSQPPRHQTSYNFSDDNPMPAPPIPPFSLDPM